jgi:glycosyltransferase involved in cell wall biosynthesis
MVAVTPHIGGFVRSLRGLTNGSAPAEPVCAADTVQLKGKSQADVLRPLLIAEAANPEWTSVPLVGWNLAHAIMKRTNALLVTQVRNRDALMRAGLVEEKDFIAIDNERIARRLYRIGEVVRGGSNKGWTVVTALSSLAYYSFEQQVWQRLGERLRAGEFDVVHRITPLSPTSQSPIARKLKKHGIPFVLGPLNGGVPWPEGFGDVRSREREWLSKVRGIHSLMPYYRTTRAGASALIAGSRHTLGELPADCADRSFLIPENAADTDRFPFQLRKLDGGKLAVAFIGRLVPYKGADMLIEAVAAYRGKLSVEVLIIGDGPQRGELEAAVQRHGLQNRIRFAGWLDHKDFPEVLSQYHALALPSVREFGGGVVLEAMSMGLVPIVANYGGPPELLDEQSGISVDFTDRDTLITGFTAALAMFENDPALLATLSAGAGERVRKRYTWEVKADQILQVYNWVLARRSKPEF